MHRPNLSPTPLARAVRPSQSNRTVLPGALLTLMLLGSSAAYAEQVSVNIAAQPLSTALQQLGQQTQMQILYSPELVQGLKSSPVSGSLSTDEVLQRMLQGSGLSYRVDGHTILLMPPPSTGEAALELSPTSISGMAPGSVTEGSGLYTTYMSSSSTRLNLTQKETPQSVTVVTRQRLDDQKLTNLTEVLEATPGITVLRTGIGAENDTYWSRGFQINNFEIDGVPTSPRLDNTTQSTAMYDRVEIVRGATGLISGTGTPSATINMIRKRPTATFQGSVTAEAGSWDRYGTGFDVSGPLTDSGNVRGRLVVDYKTQNSFVDRLEQDTQLIYGISEFDLSEATMLTVGFSYLKTQVNDPLRTGFQVRYADGSKTDFSRSKNSSPTWSYNDRKQTNVFTSLEHQFDNGWSGKVELSHSVMDFDELINYMNGEISSVDGSGAYMYPNRWSGKPRQNNLDAYLTGPFTLFGREHELITGVTLSRYTENTPDHGGWFGPWTGYDGTIDNIWDWKGQGPRPDTTTVGKTYIQENQYAAYMTGRFHVTDDLAVILGGRVTDWRRTSDYQNWNDPTFDNKSDENRHGVFLPYAGVVYDLNDTWSVYGSYTKIFNPQPYGVHDENFKALDPQEGTGYELGVKGSFNDEKLNASLALFRIEQDNLPVYVRAPDIYRAEQGTTTEGVELELNGELAEGWQAFAGYAYSVSTDSDDNRIVTNNPRHSAKTFTTYRLPGILDNKLTIGGGVNWQSKTGQDLHTFTQGSYAVTNLMARYDITQNLSASLNLNNVFDRKYFSYVDSWGVYGAPRNFMTSVQYKF
ncbi:TonB-dependent siderophore receptor [Pseudomonas sp. 10-1B]|uniref:TonB-dependent siderophore receptor n=1 Tax=Pseudomonas sp. 10-1B TaxID=1546029 RepID=UPI0009E56139|nr:TonB-dependent siderophore receptor [Pseudomonas sp. 10-1B]